MASPTMNMKRPEKIPKIRSLANMEIDSGEGVSTISGAALNASSMEVRSSIFNIFP